MSVVSVVRERSLRRADHSYRGVLPNVVRRRVGSRNLINEALAHLGGGGGVEGAVEPKTNKEPTETKPKYGKRCNDKYCDSKN